MLTTIWLSLLVAFYILCGEFTWLRQLGQYPPISGSNENILVEISDVCNCRDRGIVYRAKMGTSGSFLRSRGSYRRVHHLRPRRGGSRTFNLPFLSPHNDDLGIAHCVEDRCKCPGSDGSVPNISGGLLCAFFHFCLRCRRYVLRSKVLDVQCHG